MSEIINYKGYKIEIQQDSDAENPYKDWWDQLSDVNFWLRNYNLDSTGKGQLGFDSPQEVEEAYKEGRIVYYAPVYAYIHSGISVSLGQGYPFDCPWDSGLAGMVYVTKEKAEREFPKYSGRTLWLACERVARVEIETLDQYLTGDVWGFVVKKKKEVVDSCCGFYGYDYCLSEAKGVVDQLVEAQERLEMDLRMDWELYSCPC